ncbi:hypothetical protein ACJZ2D_014598 [Fusarium nematophilum]
MMFLQVFLSLVASVSAIDIWLGWRNGGNSVHCANINPNTCCGASGSGSPFASLDFREIPSNWDVSIRSHRGPRCGAVVHSEASRSRRNIRMNGTQYGGGGYGFLSKRSESAEEGCAKTEKPSILAFADEAQYNVTDLDNALFAEMLVTVFFYTDPRLLRTCPPHCPLFPSLSSPSSSSN